MVEQVQEIAGAEMPLGAMKLPLSDEVLASLAAVQRAQEAARARVRRQTVRTRAWFGAIVGAVGLAVILFGPRVGRQLAASPSRVAGAAPVAATASPSPSPSPVAVPPAPPVASPAKSEAEAKESVVGAPSAGLVAAEPTTIVASGSAPHAKAVASDDTGGCRVAAGQARWRVDVDACATIFESRPNDAALALTIAHAHHARGHMAQSGEWARRAIALDSRSAEAFVILARAEVRAGRPDAATQAYRRYLALVPRGWHASEARAALRRLDEHARKPGSSDAAVARN